MPLDIILFSFTIAPGIIAFLNLCGVIMLQLIFELYGIVLQLQGGTTASNHNSKFSSRKLVYAILGGLVTTTGFITIFSGIGLGFHVMDLDNKIISMDRLCKCTSCYRNRNSKSYGKILLPQHPDFQILFRK
jgi:hypothetical protein